MTFSSHRMAVTWTAFLCPGPSCGLRRCAFVCACVVLLSASADCSVALFQHLMCPVHVKKWLGHAIMFANG